MLQAKARRRLGRFFFLRFVAHDEASYCKSRHSKLIALHFVDMKGNGHVGGDVPLVD